MKWRIRLNKENLDEAVAAASGILKRGGVIIYPTDTLYGLGADAFSDKAVEKIYEIKGREGDKPIHAAVKDLGMAEQYAEITGLARKLTDAFWPGPLTLVLKRHKEVRAGIAKKIPTIGIRVPNDKFCLALCSKFGGLFTATSANKSGLPPPRSIGKILEQLGPKASLIDLIIDAGQLPPRAPSTVVDVSGARPIIVREGAIPSADIWNELRSEL